MFRVKKNSKQTTKFILYIDILSYKIFNLIFFKNNMLNNHDII